MYFTSHCIVECMHVHASDERLTEAGSAKFLVKSNGDTIMTRQGVLSTNEAHEIQLFIKANLDEMYLTWKKSSDNDFYKGN